MLALMTRPAPVLPVSGAVAWYDASDLSTLVLSGQKVTQWNSKAGGGNVANGTDANRPLSGINTINGLNALQFNGSSQYLSGTAVLAANPYTWFGVAIGNGAAGSQRTVISTFNGAGGNSAMYRTTTDTITIYSGTVVTLAGGVNWKPSVPHVLSAVMNGASSVFTRDGCPSAGAVNVGAGAPGTTSWGIGAQADGINRWLGLIGEVLIYASALSVPNRLAVEQYLIQKWLY